RKRVERRKRRGQERRLRKDHAEGRYQNNVRQLRILVPLSLDSRAGGPLGSIAFETNRAQVKAAYSQRTRSVFRINVEGCIFSATASLQSVVRLGCRIPLSIWLTKVRPTSADNASPSCETPDTRRCS